MQRRILLRAAAAAPWLAGMADYAGAVRARTASRVRPTDPDWPTARQWDGLRDAVGGRLIAPQSPLTACNATPGAPTCADLFKDLKNPYFIGDNPGLAQTLAWIDAWTFQPSVFAVTAESAADVAAAVNFARTHRVRLVIKGGGHCYLGRSNAADSLLVWTRRMNQVVLHDAFVVQGCAGKVAPQPAVSVGAGAIWGHVYNAVTTRGGRYVQGGGCLTVGVAGLVQGGGFGSFSKLFGTAAANLLEAEIVTADGAVRIVNACRHPELFWGLKGGGGGTLGVVTRLTLKTHALPDQVGGVRATIHAASDAALRDLIGRFVALYAEALHRPEWGEIVTLRPGRHVDIRMSCLGVTQAQAEAIWRPFFAWVAQSPQDFTLDAPPLIRTIPARRMWDPAFLRTNIPEIVRTDDRPGAPSDNIFWAGNVAEAGHVIYAYQSLWLPRALLHAARQPSLVDALCEASTHGSVELHFQKGLAGAAPAALAATRDTAMNPNVLDAFVLAIVGAEAPPAYPGIAGHEPDAVRGRAAAGRVSVAMQALRKLAPDGGCYFAESDYFEQDWQRAYWGRHYRRLLAAKRRYDPDGLFFVRHGAGSEDWSADGFGKAPGRP